MLTDIHTCYECKLSAIAHLGKHCKQCTVLALLSCRALEACATDVCHRHHACSTDTYSLTCIVSLPKVCALPAVCSVSLSRVCSLSAVCGGEQAFCADLLPQCNCWMMYTQVILHIRHETHHAMPVSGEHNDRQTCHYPDPLWPCAGHCPAALPGSRSPACPCCAHCCA